MENPKKKVYLSKANLETLANGGTLTSGSDTFTGDEDSIYMTPETIDSTPTQNSENLVTSGGVYSALANKQDSTDNNLNTTSKTVTGAINEVNSIAKEANKAEGFASYSALITALNSASATAYNVGQSFYVQTLDVPDLWIMSVESSSSSYTYTTDAAFITATGASGGQQVGYYKLAQLETQKVDLTNYVQKSTTIAGVDLQDNITKTELLTALNVADGAQVNDVTDVQVNGTSILSSKVANIVTETAYNPSTNKIATMTDVSNKVSATFRTWS